MDPEYRLASVSGSFTHNPLHSRCSSLSFNLSWHNACTGSTPLSRGELKKHVRDVLNPVYQATMPSNFHPKPCQSSFTNQLEHFTRHLSIVDDFEKQRCERYLHRYAAAFRDYPDPLESNVNMWCSLILSSRALRC